MRETMAVVAGVFSRRYTGKQKTAFINYTEKWARENKIRFREDNNGQKGRNCCRNLYLGNRKRADTLVVVPYDTSSRILWPGIRYYPLNAKKNLKNEIIAMSGNLLLAAGLTAGYYGLILSRYLHGELSIILLSILGMFLIAMLDTKLLFGMANRQNNSRNSASVVIALEYLKRNRASAAVALLDQASSSFAGYRRLAEYLGDRALEKRLIILDCAASGEELLAHCLREEAGEIKYAGPELQMYILKKTESGRNVLELFPKGIVLTGGIRKGQETLVKDTRCGKDSRVDLVKMEKTVRILSELASV